MIVDVHAHILAEEFLSGLADEHVFGIEHGEGGTYVFPGYGPLDRWLYDIGARTESLRARDVELQLVAPPPRMVSHATWSADVEFARRLDAQTAQAAAMGEGLLAGLATPCFNEPARAAEELRRAVGEYGFKGVAIASSAAGAPLDAPEFDEMLQIRHFRGFVAERQCPRGFLKRKLVGQNRKPVEDDRGAEVKAIRASVKIGNRHRVSKNIVESAHPGRWFDRQLGLDQAEVVTVARPEHEPVLAERNGPGIGVRGLVFNRQPLHGRISRRRETYLS